MGISCPLCGAWPGKACTRECDASNTPDELVRKPRRCSTCGDEMSEFLDAYYGQNSKKAGQCSPCRDGRKS